MSNRKILTRRLFLQPLANNSVADLAHLIDTSVSRGFHPSLRGLCYEEYADWLETRVSASEYVSFAVFHGNQCEIFSVESDPIGVVSLRIPENSLSYWFGRKFWNRGYATESVGAVVRNSSRMGLLRSDAKIMALVERENIASVRVLEKSGFMFAGIERSRLSDASFHSATCLRYSLQS